MNIIRSIQISLALVAGALLIGYGGMDDSPGAQGIGLLLILSTLTLLIHYFWNKTKL